MFWDNFKQELEYKGIQIKEFCGNNDLNYNSICNAISKNTIPNIELAYKIASSLKVSIEFLFTGKHFEFSDSETLLIAKFRTLSKENQQLVQKFLDIL